MTERQPKFLTNTKLKKNIILIIILLLILFAIILTTVLFVFPFVRIRIFGISLKPTEDIPIRQITYYTQNDTKWRNDTIGNSNSTIGGVGCVISCVSTAISDLENKSVTPQEFNKIMTQVEGFDGAYLIWYKINEVFPDLNYRADRVFTRDTIESDLKNGFMPIVKVNMPVSGIEHWVIIIGAKDGQFIISDPLNGDRQPIPLSKYGKVYKYRVIIKN